MKKFSCFICQKSFSSDSPKEIRVSVPNYHWSMGSTTQTYHVCGKHSVDTVEVEKVRVENSPHTIEEGEKITANNPVHFIECKFCGAKITESPHEVWANVPDDQIDWAIEDNEKMAKEAADFWDKQVDEFIEVHKDCQNR